MLSPKALLILSVTLFFFCGDCRSSSPLPGDNLLHLTVDLTLQEFSPWSQIATWSYLLLPGTSGKIPDYFVVEICHKFVKNGQVSTNLNATILSYQGSFGFTSWAIRFDSLDSLEWEGRGVVCRISVVDVSHAEGKVSMWAARAGESYTEQDLKKIQGPGSC